MVQLPAPQSFSCKVLIINNLTLEFPGKVLILNGLACKAFILTHFREKRKGPLLLRHCSSIERRQPASGEAIWIVRIRLFRGMDGVGRLGLRVQGIQGRWVPRRRIIGQLLLGDELWATRCVQLWGSTYLARLRGPWGIVLMSARRIGLCWLPGTRRVRRAYRHRGDGPDRQGLSAPTGVIAPPGAAGRHRSRTP